MFKFEVMDALVNLIQEEVIEHAISRSHYDVAVLQLLRVVVRMLGEVLTHVVVDGPQGLPQLLQLLNAALLFEDLELLFAWQNGELERNVEGVLLLLGSVRGVGLAISKSDQDEAAVAEVRDVY